MDDNCRNLRLEFTENHYLHKTYLFCHWRVAVKKIDALRVTRGAFRPLNELVILISNSPFLQENIECEIFGTLLEEARDSYDEVVGYKMSISFF